MALVRRRLSWRSCIWLACQFAGLAIAPFALCCEDASASDMSDLPECCKAVGPGETCPMHHNTSHDDSTCKMRNACSKGDSALISLSGGIGVLPSSTFSVSAFTAGDRLTMPIESAPLRSTRPESPPPRV